MCCYLKRPYQLEKYSEVLIYDKILQDIMSEIYFKILQQKNSEGWEGIDATRIAEC